MTDEERHQMRQLRKQNAHLSQQLSKLRTTLSATDHKVRQFGQDHGLSAEELPYVDKRLL